MERTPDYEAKVLEGLGSRVSIHPVEGGGWYACQSGVETTIRGSGILSSPTGRGRTPTCALANLFNHMTGLADDKYIVVHACGSSRRACRWNGATWVPVAE